MIDKFLLGTILLTVVSFNVKADVIGDCVDGVDLLASKAIELGLEVRDSNSKSVKALERSCEKAANKAPDSALVNSSLLYTSPSPRDQRGSRMPSSA